MRSIRGKGIPYVNLTIIAVNIIYFLFLEIVGSTYDTDFMIRFGAMYAPAVIRGHQYYRLLTSVFMHFGIEHIANNMLILFILGGHLEHVMGRTKYLILYLVCGVGANIVSLLVTEQSQFGFVVSAGASGAVFGVIGGLVYVVAVNRGRVEDLSTQQLIIVIILSLYLGYVSGNVDNAAHVAGLAIGILAAAILYWKPKRPVKQG